MTLHIGYSVTFQHVSSVQWLDQSNWHIHDQRAEVLHFGDIQDWWYSSVVEDKALGLIPALREKIKDCFANVKTWDQTPVLGWWSDSSGGAPA
jgi:hypothetical protein